MGKIKTCSGATRKKRYDRDGAKRGEFYGARSALAAKTLPRRSQTPAENGTAVPAADRRSREASDRTPAETPAYLRAEFEEFRFDSVEKVGDPLADPVAHLIRGLHRNGGSARVGRADAHRRGSFRGDGAKRDVVDVFFHCRDTLSRAYCRGVSFFWSTPASTSLSISCCIELNAARTPCGGMMTRTLL